MLKVCLNLNNMKIWFKYIVLTLLSGSLILIAYLQFSTISTDTLTQQKEELKQLEASDAPFIAKISTSKNTYKIGESLDLTVEIVNRTDSTVWMVGSLDGSERGLRPPFCGVIVQHSFFSPSPSLGMCGLLNSMRIQDFKAIPTNGSFNPYERIDDYGFVPPSSRYPETFSYPGKYNIQFYYYSKAEERFDSPFLPLPNTTEDSLFQLVPLMQLKSNTITVKYEW